MGRTTNKQTSLNGNTLLDYRGGKNGSDCNIDQMLFTNIGPILGLHMALILASLWLLILVPISAMVAANSGPILAQAWLPVLAQSWIPILAQHWAPYGTDIGLHMAELWLRYRLPILAHAWPWIVANIGPRCWPWLLPTLVHYWLPVPGRYGLPELARHWPGFHRALGLYERFGVAARFWLYLRSRTT